MKWILGFAIIGAGVFWLFSAQGRHARDQFLETRDASTQVVAD